MSSPVTAAATTSKDSGAPVTTTWSAFGKSAALRALYTAAATAAAYFGGTQLDKLPYMTILSAAAMSAILSLVTSSINLPEFFGATKHPAEAYIDRAIRTFGQALLAGLGTHYLFQQVDWPTILQTAMVATIGTLLRSFLTGLPEAANLSLPATGKHS